MPDRKFSLSAHIFTRDLRTDDNPALLSALESSGCVITCFAEERNLSAAHSPGCGNRLAFLSESLDCLSSEIAKKGGVLGFYPEGAVNLAEELCRSGVEAVFMTHDYTPYAGRREALVEKACNNAGCSFFAVPGSLLNEPEEVKKKDGGNYTVFTPFFRKASLIPVYEPRECTYLNFSREDFPGKTDSAVKTVKRDPGENKAIFRGGRNSGLELLENTGRLVNYEKERNYPAVRGTSMLSAHLRFGTVSIREAFHAVAEKLGPGHGLIRQLYWRDFFTHVAFFHPYVFKGPFHRRFESLTWSNNGEIFERWCSGGTGFPIVDAGMREMNETGYMHNRVRMVAASFLVKDLHIDWRRGERYFATKLTDYDPSVNNGNWQWAASTGCDAQPYFRIFNPWLQQKKFDPECLYIRRWIPELSEAQPEEIHNLYRREDDPPGGYPKPVTDHKAEAQAAKILYSDAARSEI